LFDAILAAKSGVVFAIDNWDECLERLRTPKHKVQLAIPELFVELDALATATPSLATTEFPCMLSAGANGGSINAPRRQECSAESPEWSGPLHSLPPAEHSNRRTTRRKRTHAWSVRHHAHPVVRLPDPLERVIDFRESTSPPPSQ